MLQLNSAESNRLDVSEHEEYIWMLQLQEPEKLNKHLEIWQIDQHIDQSILISALQKTIQTFPDLNARYKFTEEGVLYKYHALEQPIPIQIQQRKSDEIATILSELNQQPWHPENDPPFDILLIQSEQNTFIILALHPILEQNYQLEDIAKHIAKNDHFLLKNESSLNWSKVDLTTLNFADENKKIIDAESVDKERISTIILDEFRQILAEPEMSLDDDFFDFGGHSLLATRVIGHLQNRYGIELSFNDFFKSPSAVQLAEFAVLKNPISEQSLDQELDQAPLTLAQDFLWKAYTAFDFSPVYNLPFAVEFQAEIDENAFYQAFKDIVERHVGLRTIFKTENHQTYQKTVAFSKLNQYKWFWNSTESMGITLADEAQYKFDLSHELPIRIRLIKNSKNHQVLSFLVHHMVIDEWSLNTIMADLAHAYLARLQNQAPTWQVPVRSIQNFALLQEKQKINQQHIDYWTAMLQGATKGLQLNAQSDPEQTPQVKWLELKFDPEIYQSLSSFSRKHAASIFSVLYTTIALCLQKEGNLKEIVIGTSASGRTNPDFFETVGYFTTMVAHRVRFNPQQSFELLLQDVSAMIVDSINYADIPINHIQKALGMREDEGLIFDVYVHIHSNNSLNGRLKTPQNDVQYRQILPERNESMFGLHFEIMENLINDQHQLSLIITYQAHRYPTEQVERIAGNIQQILTQLQPVLSQNKSL